MADRYKIGDGGKVTVDVGALVESDAFKRTVEHCEGASATRMNSVLPNESETPQSLISQPVIKGSRGWIATGPSGRVLHFGEADGWRVDQVVGPFDNATPPDAAAVGSTGNAEVSNETPTPSPDVGSRMTGVPREPTAFMWRMGAIVHLEMPNSDLSKSLERQGFVKTALYAVDKLTNPQGSPVDKAPDSQAGDGLCATRHAPNR